MDNQIFPLGMYGISKYLTGIMFILNGLKARHLAPIMLLVIHIVYIGGSAIISRTASPTAHLGGAPYMLIYFTLTIAASIAILVIKIKNRRVKE